MWWEREGHLEVKANRLFVAGVSAQALAKDFGTPLYVLNGNRVIENFRCFKEAFSKQGIKPRIHYAMKANSHFAVLQLLNAERAWIDAVSPNEVRIALKAGFPKERILFTGTSVSNRDLEELISLGVRINVDSFSQMKRMREMGFKGEASIRWNPGEGAGFHEHTITAGKFIKFGIPEHLIEEAFAMAKGFGFRVVGLHQHIGSGWTGPDVETFLETVSKTVEVAKKAESILGRSLEFVDFGGGPGIRYRKEQPEFPLEKYAAGIAKKMRASGLKASIAVEPGRFIVGDAAVLLCEINTVEEKNIPIIGVNAGFGTLVRPAMYGSYHEMVLCENVNGREKKQFMVAGNLCESGDIFTESKKELRELPVPEEGQMLAILNAGAYGFSMASSYNSRPMPACIMLLNKKTIMVRERQSLDDIIKGEKMI